MQKMIWRPQPKTWGVFAVEIVDDDKSVKGEEPAKLVRIISVIEPTTAGITVYRKWDVRTAPVSELSDCRHPIERYDRSGAVILCSHCGDQRATAAERDVHGRKGVTFYWDGTTYVEVDIQTGEPVESE
ncbi:hypothetical protein A2716_02575 [candidate division WWE3 bacterium RIFCSPHIGHO2_01_FULL_40_23]|uniref:Uncharacterized protein n=1 Tax=candidate division WWE3 bacterium RIFCSPLOWO2_01_FULL_41_18 TaxID=1802625 RepID=A0A1F4VFX2_UNCKA|nr:MAG: hypothetical protein A2716_02575 [candidate division WWE3 bacterium RIFCSPHIGHO2_01_FULL_40_23]OGC55870.1 MAG: hypothetical protein A3A78_02425 [candidate division WWE3 bacterium RIFCSPLOWO2_01_FULL_41_18]